MGYMGYMGYMPYKYNYKDYKDYKAKDILDGTWIVPIVIVSDAETIFSASNPHFVSFIGSPNKPKDQVTKWQMSGDSNLTNMQSGLAKVMHSTPEVLEQTPHLSSQSLELLPLQTSAAVAVIARI